MTVESVAQALTGIEYPYVQLFSADKANEIAASNLVIAACADHNEIVFCGAINEERFVDEINPLIYLDSEGLLPSFDFVDHSEYELREYFRRELQSKKITLVWDQYWFFRTDIPHATFDMIDENGDLFCRGIVFSMQALSQTNQPDHDRDRELMAVCAIRYAIGRQSYIVSDAVRWAREFGASSPSIRNVIINDLEEAVQREDNGFLSLGAEMDSKAWRAVLADLKAMTK
jgi:hypothetical protein